MRAAAVLLAAVAVVPLAGCGGDDRDAATTALGDTAARVGRIHSATLDLRMTLAPRDAARGGQVGFALAGAVDVKASGLPVAKLRYTQIAGRRTGSATLITDGRQAFVEVDGTPYRLGAARTAALGNGTGAVRRELRLPVGRWVLDPRLAGRQSIAGADTDHITGRLDAAGALRDIFGAARAAGAAVPDLGGSGADELRKAIDGASVDVWTGHDDRLLRRLRLAISFRVTPPASLREQLGDVSGGRFAFDVTLGAVNRPVHVGAPANARPASALRG